MTRTASDAKRRGAAVLIINFARPREVFGLPSQYFASSFFAAQTPTRANQIKLWYGRSSRCFASSVVLYGSGGRTAKRLKSNGSTVLFQSLTHDACAGARARAHIGGVQNYRTLELNHKTQQSCEVDGSTPVLLRFCSRTGNKQWGGYATSAFADVGDGRQLGDRLDLGVDRRAARGKFWRWAQPVAVARRSGGVARGVDGNRAISAVYVGAIGRVGMPVSEWSAISVVFQCVAVAVCKPARLSDGPAAVALAAPIGRGGRRAGREGGTPPSAARPVTLPFAQPIFRGSADLRNRCPATTVGFRERRLTSGRKMGSGVCRLPSIAGARRGGAKAMRQERVGVQGGVLGWGRSRERMTLWGGAAGVN